MPVGEGIISCIGERGTLGDWGSPGDSTYAELIGSLSRPVIMPTGTKLSWKGGSGKFFLFFFKKVRYVIFLLLFNPIDFFKTLRVHVNTPDSVLTFL